MSGTYNGNITLNATGSGTINYGPANPGSRTINGDVTINGNSTGTINLRNLVITGDLTINTPNAHVTGAITTTVGGNTNVVAVSNTSFVSQATHTGGIVITDTNGASIDLSGNASNANVTIDTDGTVRLLGSFTGTVTVTQAANLVIDEGASISNLLVGEDATGTVIENNGTITDLGGTGEAELSGDGKVTKATNENISTGTIDTPGQALTKGEELEKANNVLKASFTWSSENGVGTKFVEKPARYNYFNDGAYLDITVKKDNGDNVAFSTLFDDMTLVTDGGNTDSIKGTGGRQAEDWAGTEGPWKTKLKTDGTKAVFYGVRQTGTGTAVGATRTVGFNAGDSRTIDLALTPKDDLVAGTYTVTIQPKQQTGVTTGEELGEAITYLFTIEEPEVVEPTIENAVATRNDDGDIVLTVKATGQNLKSLEVDHSHGKHGKWASANLPEFTVYSLTENPWGSDSSKTQAATAGVEALYDADTQTWTLTLKNNGQAMQVINGEISNGAFEFYLVVNDQAGNSSGDMNGNYKKVVVDALTQ